MAFELPAHLREKVTVDVKEDANGTLTVYRKNGKLVCGFCTYGNRRLRWHETRLTALDGTVTVNRLVMCEYCLKMAGVPPWSTRSWREEKKNDGEDLKAALTRAKKEEQHLRYTRDGERRPCSDCRNDVLMYMTAYDNPMYMHTARVSAKHLDREDQWTFANADRRVHPIKNAVPEDTSVMFPHWLVCPVKRFKPPEEWTLRAIWGSMGGRAPVDTRYTDALLPREQQEWGTETPLF